METGTAPTSSSEIPAQTLPEWETPEFIEMNVNKTAGAPGFGTDGGAPGDNFGISDNGS